MAVEVKRKVQRQLLFDMQVQEVLCTNLQICMYWIIFKEKKKSCFGCIHDVHKVIGNQSIFKVIEQEKKILFTFTQEFGLM